MVLTESLEKYHLFHDLKNTRVALAFEVEVDDMEVDVHVVLTEILEKYHLFHDLKNTRVALAFDVEVDMEVEVEVDVHVEHMVFVL